MSSLSFLATYDDLIRCQTVLMEDDAEVGFRQFLQCFEEYRAVIKHTQDENYRLQRELDQSITNISNLENMLGNARRMVEMEKRRRREVEHERDGVEKKMKMVRDLLKQERDIRDETRDKLAFLNSPRKRRSHLMSDRIHEEADETCDHMNSTGSLLSDMSVTKSEDDFLDCRTSNQWRKPRPGLNASSKAETLHRRSRLSTERKRRSTSRAAYEIDDADEIVASTKVSLPKNGRGPIVAESTITAQPSSSSTAVVTIPEPVTPKRPKQVPASPFASKRSRSPTAPLEEDMEEMLPEKVVTYSALRKKGPAPKTPTAQMCMSTTKRHQFATKTIFVQSDSCSHCGKRIRFSSNCLKCRDCRATLHIQCREAYTANCIPSTNTHTPTGKLPASITDYAPNIGPMVPALIVHCVNEIEARGLQEEGLYRHCGSDSMVKQLKDGFLRGKSIPPVNNTDIHVLCGCIKDFLKSLQETLVPMSMWATFSNAAQNISPEAERQQLCDAVMRLPQANRDTLAFLIQHLQRIAACPQIKMPLDNIAKVFAPTIVGYSHRNLEANAIFAQTVVNVAVMQGLLRIPTSFWMQFVNLERPDEERARIIYPPLGPSSALRTRKEKKFYGTPPYNTKRV